MEIKLIDKENKTRFKLTRRETRDYNILHKLNYLGAKETKETTKFIYYEAAGNCLPFMLYKRSYER